MRSKFVHGNEGGFKAGLRLGMDLDTRMFDRNFTKFMNKGMIASIRKGLKHALLSLMQDICDEGPIAPKDTGALRGSITVFVNKYLVGNSSNYGPTTYQQRVDTDPAYRDGEEGKLVVNAPYATVQHEDWPVKHEPGAGRYFVMQKLVMLKKKYANIVADEMKKAKL